MFVCVNAVSATKGKWPKNSTTMVKDSDLVDPRSVEACLQQVRTCSLGCGNTLVPGASHEEDTRPFARRAGLWQGERVRCLQLTYEATKAFRLWYTSLSLTERKSAIKGSLNGASADRVAMKTPEYGVALCAHGKNSCLQALFQVRSHPDSVCIYVT